jgi:hypothetical protein
MVSWKLLTLHEARSLWKSIEAEVESCLIPENDIKQLRLLVAVGDAKIIVSHDEEGIRKCHITYTLKNGTAFLWAFFGNDIAKQQNYKGLENVWLANNVERIQGLCKPGAARLWSRFGMEPKYQIMERTIWVE